MDLKVTVRGAREIEEKLRDLGGKVASRLGDNAIRAGARVVLAAAKDKAPVGETGELKASLRVRAPRDKLTSVARASVVTDVWYARFVELGTAHMAAQPLLRPATDENGPAVLTKISSNLWNGIQRTLKRQAVAAAEPMEETL